jgi:hypothetical protein
MASCTASFTCVSTLRGVMLARRSKASVMMDWMSLMVSAPDVQTVLFNKTCRKGAKDAKKDMVFVSAS